MLNILITLACIILGIVLLGLLFVLGCGYFAARKSYKEEVAYRNKVNETMQSLENEGLLPKKE